jgi:hypothetical protein
VTEINGGGGEERGWKNRGRGCFFFFQTLALDFSFLRP